MVYMIYAGPLDEATDTANRAVFEMSRAVSGAASDATSADAASAGFKLSASLDYIAAALTALMDRSASLDERVAGTVAVGRAQEAAQSARDWAQATLDRHHSAAPEE